MAAKDYDHLFKLLIIGDSGKHYFYCDLRLNRGDLCCDSLRVLKNYQSS